MPVGAMDGWVDGLIEQEPYLAVQSQRGVQESEIEAAAEASGAAFFVSEWDWLRDEGRRIVESQEFSPEPVAVIRAQDLVTEALAVFSSVRNRRRESTR